MKRNRVRRIALSIALGMTLSACVCVDGGFMYYVTVRVAYESRVPVEDAHVVIYEQDYDLYTYYWDAGSIHTLDFMGYESTNANGAVTESVSTDLSWGGCGVSRPRRAPFPDTPASLLVIIEYPYGNMIYKTIYVTDAQVTARRRGELDIDLGTIFVDLPDESDTERPSDLEVDAGPDAGQDAGWDRQGAADPDGLKWPSTRKEFETTDTARTALRK